MVDSRATGFVDVILVPVANDTLGIMAYRSLLLSSTMNGGSQARPRQYLIHDPLQMSTTTNYGTNHDQETDRGCDAIHIIDAICVE